MNIFGQLGEFFSSSLNWTGDSGIPWRLLQHLFYTALTLVIAGLIAIPLGFYIGHTGRGAFLAINAGNAGRSLPTLGLLTLFVLLTGIGLLPALLALVILAIPPMLTTTYAAIRSVDPMIVDAARGVGMRERKILLKVEVPIGLPIILSGVRNATLQVVATATVAAFIGLGGLGRYVIDGQNIRDYGQMLAGAVLVAALAIVLELLLIGAQRLAVSPGVSGRAATRPTGR